MAKKDKKPEGSSPHAGAPVVKRAPEMERAWALYENGDNRDAAHAARTVLASNAAEEAKAEARQLLAAVRVEPGALFTFVALVVLFGSIITALILFHRQG